jgi:hypothetical protein
MRGSPLYEERLYFSECLTALRTQVVKLYSVVPPSTFFERDVVGRR